MLLLCLLLIPIAGLFIISIKSTSVSLTNNSTYNFNIKHIALTTSSLNFLLSLVIFLLFDFSTNQFQFVQEYHEISHFDLYLGVDGLSIYFVILTTMIIPISLVSNWKSINVDLHSFVIVLLLLEILLLVVFLVLDILLFYIFFESILPPLFILIGLFGSENRVKASFYLFLYTLLGSLFLLLSIIAMSSIISTTDFDTLFKGNFIYSTQLFLFYGIFIAFAVKTPTIYLNTWLLKAHVESPLGGSIILAAIVLKLSLYGIFRLILPVLPKAYMIYTTIIFLIGVLTIIYASLSTLRTIDVKELIAYSSVSHAAVYLLGVFSNNIQGIEGGINLGLAHGLVSPGLFICAGGVLYDRYHTRCITFYKGMTQLMPLFSVLFFILCLANCGAPLSLNFIGEFLSLYGVFERSSLLGIFASSSIIFSAAYTIFMYQRIAFGGSYSRMFTKNAPDLTKREFMMLLALVVPTVLFGIYPAPILDAIHYSVSTLIYGYDDNILYCDAARVLTLYTEESKSTLGCVMSLIKTYFIDTNCMYYIVAVLLSVFFKQEVTSILKYYETYTVYKVDFVRDIFKVCFTYITCFVLALMVYLFFTMLYLVYDRDSESYVEIFFDSVFSRMFEVLECSSSNALMEWIDNARNAEEFRVVHRDNVPRAIGRVDNIESFEAPTNVLSSIDKLLADLKINIANAKAEANAAKIKQLNEEIVANKDKLTDLGDKARYMIGLDIMNLSFIGNYLSKLPEFRDLRPIISEHHNKVDMFKSNFLYKNPEENPIKYYDERINYANRIRAHVADVVGGYKDYFKNNSLFTQEEKSKMLNGLRTLNRKATIITDADKKLFVLQKEHHKLLEELKK